MPDLGQKLTGIICHLHVLLLTPGSAQQEKRKQDLTREAHDAYIKLLPQLLQVVVVAPPRFCHDHQQGLLQGAGDVQIQND